MQVTKIAIPGKIIELAAPVEVVITDPFDIDFRVVDGVLRGFFPNRYIVTEIVVTDPSGTVFTSEYGCPKNDDGANILKFMPSKDPYTEDILLTVKEVGDVQRETD